MVTKFLGIDHPLIVVRDLEAMRANYERLGFIMTPPGKHPWGTSTSVAIMDDSLVELMGIYDETLLEEKPAGAFRFGRYIADQLAEREGVSLTALHSKDALADAREVGDRGIASQGTIEFGRDVVLPDGTKDRTATTLMVIQDDELPRLSNFICQQHRPELIYIPKWRAHPNGASGYAQVTMVADRQDAAKVRARLDGLYGSAALFETPDGFGARTGQGAFLVLEPDAFEQAYGELPEQLRAGKTPFIAALHIKISSVPEMVERLRKENIPHRSSPGQVLITDGVQFGNVFLNFVAVEGPNSAA